MNEAQRSECRVERLVMPKNKILTGTQTLWEYFLMEAGWNELPDSEKPGRVIGYFITNDGCHTCDVYWPGVGLTSTNVFSDEIVDIKA